MSAHRLRVRQMTGAETRGNAQPDFAALNPGLAGAPLLQQQQQADRDTCKDHPVRDPGRNQKLPLGTSGRGWSQRWCGQPV